MFVDLLVRRRCHALCWFFFVTNGYPVPGGAPGTPTLRARVASSARLRQQTASSASERAFCARLRQQTASLPCAAWPSYALAARPGGTGTELVRVDAFTSTLDDKMGPIDSTSAKERHDVERHDPGATCVHEVCNVLRALP